MIVVADTTPLNYLVLIGQIELLPALYKSILIPLEVHAELLRAKAPTEVRMWAGNLPAWCEARGVTSTADASLSELDAGERDAILLAATLYFSRLKQGWTRFLSMRVKGGVRQCAGIFVLPEQSPCWRKRHSADGSTFAPRFSDWSRPVSDCQRRFATNFSNAIRKSTVSPPPRPQPPRAAKSTTPRRAASSSRPSHANRAAATSPHRCGHAAAPPPIARPPRHCAHPETR